jgi:hypothetical protein
LPKLAAELEYLLSLQLSEAKSEPEKPKEAADLQGFRYRQSSGTQNTFFRQWKFARLTNELGNSA